MWVMNHNCMHWCVGYQVPNPFFFPLTVRARNGLLTRKWGRCHPPLTSIPICTFCCRAAIIGWMFSKVDERYTDCSMDDVEVQGPSLQKRDSESESDCLKFYWLEEKMLKKKFSVLNFPKCSTIFFSLSKNFPWILFNCKNLSDDLI